MNACLVTIGLALLLIAGVAAADTMTGCISTQRVVHVDGDTVTFGGVSFINECEVPVTIAFCTQEGDGRRCGDAADYYTHATETPVQPGGSVATGAWVEGARLSWAACSGAGRPKSDGVGGFTCPADPADGPACELAGWPAAAGDQGLAWCPAKVIIQVRSQALTAAAAWCAYRSEEITLQEAVSRIEEPCRILDRWDELNPDTTPCVCRDAPWWAAMESESR